MCDFGGVAVRAEDPHRLGRVLERGFGRDELRHPGFEVAAPSLVEDRRGSLGEQAGRRDPARHVGELQLDRLVLRRSAVPIVSRTFA